MSTRQALVVASQCAREEQLSFVPALGRELCSVLTDRRRGMWTPALEQGALMVDPTLAELRHRLEQAFTSADRSGAVLLLSFLGHGVLDEDDEFFFLPQDGERGRARCSLPLIRDLGDLRKEHPHIPGVVLLVDACASGGASASAAARWARLHRSAFEVLAATSDDLAYDGCFSRTTVRVLSQGHPTLASDVIRCTDLEEVLRSECPDQEPHHVSWKGDASLHLGLNAAYLTPFGYMMGVQEWGQAGLLTTAFVPTDALRELVALDSRFVAITGSSGSGKSTLVAALARYDHTRGVVPEGFLHGLVFLDESTTSDAVAERLCQQLTRRVPGFGPALDELERAASAQRSKDSLERLVLDPLRNLESPWHVRLALDGVDLVASESARQLERALLTISTDDRLSHVRVLLTRHRPLERPPIGLPPGTHELLVGPASVSDMTEYLGRRGVREDVAEQLLERIDGNWLIGRVLADLAQGEHVDVAALPVTLSMAYRQVTQSVQEALGPDRRARLEAVLSVLVVAGAGPVLPVELLVEASRRLGGPDDRDELETVLRALRGHVVRGLPGSDEETVGLFHATFVRHLVDDSPDLQLQLPAAHRAVTEALRQLAPPEEHWHEHPLHRYAERAEADHLAVLGLWEDSFESLTARAARQPDENVNRLRSWLAQLETQDAPPARLVLRARRALAERLAEGGRYGDALDLVRSLRSEVERTLPQDDPLVLGLHHDLARHLAMAGRFRQSQAAYEDVLHRYEERDGLESAEALVCRWRAAALQAWTGDVDGAVDALTRLEPELAHHLGHHHRETLLAGSALALSLALKGRSSEACDLLARVVPELSAQLGEEHGETLWARCSAAYVHGVAGDGERARRELTEVLPLLRSVYGPQHPATLVATYFEVFVRGASGPILPAVQQLDEVVPQLTHALGPDHVHTLMARGVRAFLLGYSGDFGRALGAYAPLLRDMERVLGRDHWQTLVLRSHMLQFQGRADPGSGALSELNEHVVPRLRTVLGELHPQTLLARASAAYLTAFTGDPGAALDAYDAVLADLRRGVGERNPQTLVAERNKVWLLLFAGRLVTAARHSRKVLPVLEAVLGEDHLHTLVARDTHDFVWAMLGGWQAASRRLPRTVAALEASVGRDNPFTLVATAHLAIVQGWSGDLPGARATFDEVLPRMRDVLGSRHPQVLLASCNYAVMLAPRHPRQSLALYEDVLPALERELGQEHPLCLFHRGQEALLTLLTGQPLIAVRRLGVVGVGTAKRVARQPARTLNHVASYVAGPRPGQPA